MRFCTGTYCKLSGRKCFYGPDPICPLGWLEALRWVLWKLFMGMRMKRSLKSPKP